MTCKPSHPHPLVLADHLTEIARQLRSSGLRAMDAAAILGARGYPSSTLGSGTSSGSQTTSSTERAAGVLSDSLALDPPDAMFVDIDARLAQATRLMWYASLSYQSLAALVLSHASDDDPIPVGTGYCVVRVCETFCRPTAERPDNRLRSGLCPAHHQRWLRFKRTNPDRQAFIASCSGEEDAA